MIDFGDKIPLFDFETSQYFDNCSVKYYNSTNWLYYQINFKHTLNGYDKLLLRHLFSMADFKYKNFELVITKQEIVNKFPNLYYKNDLKEILSKFLCYGISFGKFNNWHGCDNFITSMRYYNNETEFEIGFQNLDIIKEKFLL
jgi:hypothetical protein